MKHDAIFVLSTGRCGTQWLHDTMQSTYGDAICATHEPLLTAYRPRQYLRAAPDTLDGMTHLPEVAAHVAHIREQLQQRPYFEAGWPCFAALPWLYRALEGRMRIVHLTRHPVPTAFSMATHAVYDRDDWILDGALTPFDAGCLRESLQTRWPEMSGYEKSLFWWTELHRYALDLKRDRPEIPWHTLSYEAMFAPHTDALESLAAFCGLPYRLQLNAMRGQTTDRYRFRTPPDDWRKIMRYPDTLEVCQSLGYDPEDIDKQRISRRYFQKRKSRLRRYLSALNPLRYRPTQ